MHDQLLADIRRWLSFRRDMDDDVLRRAMTGNGNVDAAAVAALQEAAIARLSA
jgi:hypothetical protein